MKNSLKRRTAVAAPLTAGKSKRRTSSLLAAGLVAGVVMTLAPLPGAEQAQATAPSTLSVCSSGCGYTTIQSAITAATSGDTITVAAGTYAENLTINKSLTLLGPNSGIAALSGATRGAEAVVGANNVSHRVTVSGASTVEISGFKFVGTASGTGSDGIIVAGGGTGTIRNNWFDSLSNQGGTFSSADVYIQNGNAGAYTISGNRFDGPTGADPGDGTYNYSAINAWYLNDVTISGNRIENYGFSGVQAESVKQGTITDNFVKNVAANGIQVANGASTGPFVVQGNTIDHASAAYESYYAPDPIDKDYCWAGIRIWQNTTSAANQTVVSNNKIINTPAGCGAIGFTGTSRQTVNTIQNNSIDATNLEGLAWQNYLARADEVTSNVATVRLWWPNSDILVGGTVVVSDLGAPYDGTHVVTAVGSWLDATSYSYKTVSFAVSASNQATSSVTKGTVVALARAQAPIPAANNWWGSATGPGTSGSSLNSAGAGATTSPWIVSYTDDPAKAGKTGFWPTAITTATRSVCSSGCGYTTIQSAITAATSGDTITVAAGTYAENLTINKSLTLLGPNSGIAALSGATRGAEAVVGANNVSHRVTVSGASTVEISGFKFVGTASGTGSDGIIVAGGGTGTIRNNWFDSLSNQGGTFSSADVYIQNGNAGAYTISGNRFDGPTGADPGDGTYNYSAINAWYLNDVTISGNRIENYGFSGVQAESVKQGTITDNFVKNVAANGIQVANGASTGPFVVQGNTIDHASAAYESYYAPDPIDKDYCWAGIRIWQNTTSAANQTVVSNNKIINTPAGCGAIGFTGTSRQTVNTIQNNSIDATNLEGLAWQNYLARADEVTSNVATVRLWWPNSDILVGGTVVVSDLGAPYDGTHVVTAVGSWLDATSYSYKTVSFAVSASNQATSSVTKGTVVALARAQAPIPAANNWWGSATGPGTSGSSLNSAGAGATTSPWIVSYTDDPAKAGKTGFWPTAITSSSAPAITSADNATFTNGVAGSFTVTASGTPAPTFSETGTLPAGVSF
ncbi:MAG: right-handed parallel beta-helix repeat-containing protein, partial [Acidimicrobiales bacterium]